MSNYTVKIKNWAKLDLKENKTSLFKEVIFRNC